MTKQFLMLSERQAFNVWQAVCQHPRNKDIPHRIKADLFVMFGGVKSKFYQDMLAGRHNGKQ